MCLLAACVCAPPRRLLACPSRIAAFNFVDEDMSGCLDSEEWRRFLDRFKSTVAVVNMRSMFLHLDKVWRWYTYQYTHIYQKSLRAAFIGTELWQVV